MGTGSFPGVKRPERGIDHPPPSSAEVEGRVELYIYPPLWALVACYRENFTFKSFILDTKGPLISASHNIEEISLKKKTVHHTKSLCRT